jgi:DNA-binding NarL/FixJ family response regulator
MFYVSRVTDMDSTVIRALVVEDDAAWQQILSEILTDAGLAVDVADSVEAAVACLRAAPHRLAVVDLSLGGGDFVNRDGLKVLDAARRLDPGCVTLMLTGYATVELAVSALSEYGAFTCLRKERFNRAEFRDLIRKALASAPASETPQDAPGDRPEEWPHGLALVVEDDAGWRSILAELLRDAGYAVRLCSGYGEALGRLRRERFALAVVDLSLTSGPSIRGRWEEMDGYRLLASTQAGHIPTVVVSGVATPERIERMYAEQGVFAFIEKQTFDRRVFLRTVEEARAAAEGHGELDVLSRREREVLGLVAQGMTNKEIAETLYITPNTVKRHLKSIFAKLNVHTRSAAAAKAVESGMSIEWSEAEA